MLKTRPFACSHLWKKELFGNFYLFLVLKPYRGLLVSVSVYFYIAFKSGVTTTVRILNKIQIS